MRRIVSITLVLLFGSMLISPLFALGSSDASKLPACCRRDGAHHCMMSAEQLAALDRGPHLTTIHGKCPMFPAAAAAAHGAHLSFHPAPLLSAEVLSHPAEFRQLEAWARVALAGARQKRGPPATRLS